MRTTLLLLLGASFVLTKPASAQLGFSPMVGYDIDYEAFFVGFGFELPVTPGILPVSVAIRPSAEYLFIGDEIVLGDSVSTDAYRINADIIGRFRAPTLPVSPYVKAGVGVEIASTKGTILGVPFDENNTEFGLNLGAGVGLGNLFVEGTAGIGNISNFRVTAGYRF